MQRITWALLAWAVVGIVGAWVLDGASHVGGPGYPNDAPSWLLFEVWAVGFVLLATIGSKVLRGTVTTSDGVNNKERPTRRTTRLILAWTVLWIVLVGIWALDPAPSFIGSGPGSGGPIGLKPPDWALFDLWFLGFVVFGVIWLVTRWWSGRSRQGLAR